MYRTLILSLGLLLAGASSAQHQMGPMFFFQEKPYAPRDYSNNPRMYATQDHFYWPAQSGWYRISFQEGARPEELNRFSDKAKFSLPQGSDHKVLFQDHFVDIGTSWEKATGFVHVYKLAYDLAMNPIGPAEKVGTIQLAKQSQPPFLRINYKVSPNGEKLLIYYDNIKMNEFQIAMCWVLDKNLELEWHNVYKLPVQASMANRTWRFHNNGAASVMINAIEATDLRPTKDGTGERVKVSTKHKDKSVSIFVLNGDNMGRIDPGSMEMTIDDIHLMHGDEGWRFVGVFRKESDANTMLYGWGSVGSDGITIDELRPVVGGVHGIQMGADDQCFVLSDNVNDDSRSLTMMNEHGAVVWSQTNVRIGRYADFQVDDEKVFRLNKVDHKHHNAALRGEDVASRSQWQSGTFIHEEWSAEGCIRTPVFKDGIPPMNKGRQVFASPDGTNKGVFISSLSNNSKGLFYNTYGYVRYVQE